MMKREKNDYFQLIEEQIGYCVKASNLLEEILTSDTEKNIVKYKDEMHRIEHEADKIHHEILTGLSTEFITPIDQEEILHLVQVIDNITDALDEVVMKFYMFGVKGIPAYASEFSKKINCCTKALLCAGAELKNFKKPAKLREHIIEVNTIESEADHIYIEAIHTLFGKETDARILIGNKAIYDSLEECCDMCEHAADAIELIILKNT